MKNIAVIGGGASGLFVAIYLKNLLIKNDIDAQITIYERLEKTGKKILATGNGRCNFTNVGLSKDGYNNPDFVLPAIRNFTPYDLINYLKELGLQSMIDKEGRVYPYSESANTFLDILRLYIKIYKIPEICNTEIKKINCQKNQFILETTKGQKIGADIVLFATGGKAAPIHGSNGSGLQLLKQLKFKIIDPKPGLSGIMTEAADVKSLAGIRTKARVILSNKKKKEDVFIEDGEIIFKPDGISGIVVMNAESYMMRNPGNYLLRLDLIPNVTEEELFVDLKKRINDFRYFENPNLLMGYFPKMLNYMIFKKAKIDVSNYIETISDKDIGKVVKIIKGYPLEIKGTYDFERAQVTIGGINLEEVSEKTMESKMIKNLYIIGELLDIDGICGGYNLHWAFASGVLAAENILKKLKVDSKNEGK